MIKKDLLKGGQDTRERGDVYAVDHLWGKVVTNVWFAEVLNNAKGGIWN